MFRRLLKIGGVFILLLFLVVTLAFTSLEYKNATCRNIEIDYETKEVIKIDKDEIIRLVSAADNKIIGKKFDQINSEIIEEAVEKHDAILNAEVYEVVTLDADSSDYKG
ncbi:MAG: hypothetical protein R3182_02885, partial [Draconibacterium sp.]|nr:hypothetical protein [Draconibacterium sp.]